MLYLLSAKACIQTGGPGRRKQANLLPIKEESIVDGNIPNSTLEDVQQLVSTSWKAPRRWRDFRIC
jgi:hypothetical protein